MKQAPETVVARVTRIHAAARFHPLDGGHLDDYRVACRSRRPTAVIYVESRRGLGASDRVGKRGGRRWTLDAAGARSHAVKLAGVALTGPAAFTRAALLLNPPDIACWKPASASLIDDRQALVLSRTNYLEEARPAGVLASDATRTLQLVEARTRDVRVPPVRVTVQGVP